MNKQKGFTMIELVLVIVVLGIISAIAIPKFIDLQRDARLANLKAMKGALHSASNMVHAKALIQNVSFSGLAWVDMNDNGLPATNAAKIADGDIQVRFGYPRDSSGEGLENLLNMDGFTRVGAGGTTFRYKGILNCHVTYTDPASAGDQPTFTTHDSAC